VRRYLEYSKIALRRQQGIVKLDSAVGYTKPPSKFEIFAPRQQSELDFPDVKQEVDGPVLHQIR
jgi:hypothetical protein